MKLDRALQLKILKSLAEVYPKRHLDILNELSQNNDDLQEVVMANLLYLEEHGLINSGVKLHGIDSGAYSWMGADITAFGLDFLADDGGLTAILGVVTIKFHEDTLRELIGRKIETADIPQAEKKTLVNQLKELPGETIKHLTMALLDKGMENIPLALPIIRSYLGV